MTDPLSPKDLARSPAVASSRGRAIAEETPDHPMDGLAAPVSLTGDHADQPPLPVDQEGGGVSPDSICPGYQRILVKEEWKADGKFFPKAADLLRALPEVNSDDDQPCVLVCPMESFLGGSLPPAVGSGGREEPQQHHLASEVGQADRSTVQIRQRKVRRRNRLFQPKGPERGKRVVLSLC